MSNTLLVDDKDSFVSFLEEQADQWDIKDVTFCRDLDRALTEFHETRPRRVIADNTFEGSRKDGLTFLEGIRQADEKVELVLLTGNETTEKIEKRVREIRGRLIIKADVDSDLMEALLSGKQLPAPPRVETDLDIAELKLRLEEAQARLRNLEAKQESIEETAMLLVDDILEELRKAELRGEGGIMIDGRRYTPNELVEEIRMHTDIGKQLIEYHHRMFLHLREGR
jgi:ActR/RegA family two-component response regulator